MLENKVKHALKNDQAVFGVGVTGPVPRAAGGEKVAAKVGASPSGLILASGI